jgi:hypothetical protein
MRKLVRSLPIVAGGLAALLIIAFARPTPMAAGITAGNTRVTWDPERGVVEFEVGPIDLPGTGGEGGDHHGHHGAVLPPVATVRMPADVQLYGMEYDVVDGDGNPLPSHLLHHVNLIDPSTRELFLPISRRIAAAGRETGSVKAPRFLFGYPAPKGMPVVVAAMMHNETPQDYANVTLRYRLFAQPSNRPWPLMTVYPFQLDVLFPHGDKSFDLPPGRSTRSYEASPAIAGRIIGISGHVHDYATRIALENVTTGEVIWETAPDVNEEGKVTAVPVAMLWRTLGAEITPEHTYRVIVEYDNPTADTIPEGGMGVVAGLFSPAGPWPAADPSDPDYIADRLHYLRMDDEGAADPAAVTPAPASAGHDHGGHAH